MEENKNNLQEVANNENVGNEKLFIKKDDKENQQPSEYENVIENNVAISNSNQILDKNNLPSKLKMKQLTKLPSKNYLNLRYSFQNSLSKLSSHDTLENGVIEIKDFFEKNNSDQDLIIYLNLLLDEKKTYNLRCKEALVTIFSELFSRYNIRLGSEHLEMKRNITKIRNFLLKFFEETTNSFQIILSECIISLYHNCFKHKSIEDNMKIFIEPILELFQGKGNVNTHHTSSIFFQEFIQYLINNNYKKEDLRQIGEKILNLFLKLQKTSLFYELLQGLKSFLSEKDSIASLKNNEEKFLSKLISFLKAEPSKNQNINEYMCKVLQCEILSLIPSLILISNFSQSLKNEILDILKKNSSNRIVKVQKSALLAYKAWTKDILDEIPIKESPIFLQENDLNNEEKLPSQLKSNQNLCLEMQKLQQARDNFKLKKGESKYEKVPGFFQRKRINFIKKKSGLGGGFYIPFQKKKEKEFDSILKNEEAKKIREFIVKTKKNQRKEEKFVLLNEEQENLKYTKVFNIELPLEIISENKEQFKLKIEAEIPLLEEEILRNDFKDVSIEGNDKKNVNLEQQNNLINSEDRLDSITTIFKEKELGLPEIKSKKFIINQENISEIPLINHTKEVDQLIRGNFQNDEINKKEENLDNDSYFKEESEKQGDEALAHSDAFRNMMPPVIKKICSFKKLIDEPKNNIFNLSIKESIDNFSKEISPQGKIFSSMFSNLNYVASITSITLKDNKQKSKEATIEADKEISESLKMENDKENENTKNNNEEICLNMESDENLYINSQNEDDHKGQKLNKVEISQINEIEGEKTDLDVLIHNESNKANNYIQNQKNTNIIENELEFSTESQDIKKQEINDLLLKNTKIQDMNIQEKSLLEERIQRNENIFKNKIQNTICDLKDEIQKKFSSKLTNDIDEMKKEKNQELQESITKNSINDDKKYHDDTKIESSKEKKKNFEVKNNETQKKTKKSFIHGINKKFIPLKKNNDNSFNNSESLSNANEIEKVENNNVLISNGTILETEEIFDEKFSNSISIKQSPNIVNFETYGIKLDSLIENSSKETNQIKENPEKINFIESILNNSPIITKIAADKRKPGNSWRKCLYFLEKKDIDDAYSELLYCEDDIYLIRLMNITGPCINKLSISTIQKLFKRIGEIIKSSFIEQTILGFLNEASEEQTLVDNLNVGEQNQIIELLKSFTECANLKKNAEITFETFKNYLKL